MDLYLLHYDRVYIDYNYFGTDLILFDHKLDLKEKLYLNHKLMAILEIP